MSKNIVIAAAQAADSISALDAEVAAVRAVHVDTALSPNLARDVQTLQKTVAQWPNGLRARARATMTAVVTETTQASTEWKAVDRTDTKAMLGFAESLRTALTTDDTQVTQLGTAMQDLRSSSDASIASLRSDVASVNEQIANEQNRAKQLQQQVEAQSKKVEYYKDHPWKLVLDGLTITGLIKDLIDIENAYNRAKSALSDLKKVERTLSMLEQARGPILRLDTALMGLACGLTNVQTALGQISNQLTSLMSTPPAAPIIAAEIEAVLENLAAAKQIANEVLS